MATFRVYFGDNSADVEAETMDTRDGSAVRFLDGSGDVAAMFTYPSLTGIVKLDALKQRQPFMLSNIPAAAAPGV